MEEPTKKELEDIERQLDKGEYFDEEFDDFLIAEEDFNYNDEDY